MNFASILVTLAAIIGAASTAELKCAADNGKACDNKLNQLMCMFKGADPSKCATVNECVKTCVKAAGKWTCVCCDKNDKAACAMYWDKAAATKKTINCDKDTKPNADCCGVDKFPAMCAVSMDNKTKTCINTQSVCDAMYSKNATGCCCMSKDCNKDYATCQKNLPKTTTMNPNATSNPNGTTTMKPGSSPASGSTTAKGKTTKWAKTTTTTTTTTAEAEVPSGAVAASVNVFVLVVVGIVSLRVVA